MTANARIAQLRRHAESLVGRAHVSGQARAAVFAVCSLSVVAIAIMDYATSVRLSLAVIYLVPAVIAVLLLGTTAGLVVAGESATAWVVAEALITNRHDPLVLQLGNGVLRFVTLSLVVMLLAELRSVLERTRTSERRAREFLAFAAHQLRTPIAGIQATTEALILSEGTHRDRLLGNLAGEAARAGRLVHSLLRVARIDQGEPLDRRHANIRAICRTEIDRAARSSTIAIGLHVDAGADGHESVLVDPHDVGEIVANLLDNARRHAVSSVDVRIASSSRDVLVVVSDDGPGIPLGSEERVFERFVSMDGCGGAGLGLAIARGLAIKHGGSLSYTAHRFVLALPALAQGTSMSDAGGAAAAHQGPTIPIDARA
jgi:signal transduction histidine kinase